MEKERCLMMSVYLDVPAVSHIKVAVPNQLYLDVLGLTLRLLCLNICSWMCMALGTYKVAVLPDTPRCPNKSCWLSFHFQVHVVDEKPAQEAVNVNQSLFVLRRVITALSKRDNREAVHIPYRESKLTSLLQNSLGGNSYLVMFACLAPSERQDDENLSTLQYASQAAQIRNQPVVNLDPKDQLIQQLEARLAVAHDYLRRALHLSELPEDLLDEERRACRGAPKRRPPRPTAALPKAKTATNASVPPKRSASDSCNGPPSVVGQLRSLPKPASPQAKTWTGTEQRWSFDDEKEKQKSHDAVSESSRESSKSRAKNVQRKGSGDANSSTSLSRIVRGKSSMCIGDCTKLGSSFTSLAQC